MSQDVRHQGYSTEKGIVVSFKSTRHVSKGRAWWKTSVSFTRGDVVIGMVFGEGPTGPLAREAALSNAEGLIPGFTRS